MSYFVRAKVEVSIELPEGDKNKFLDDPDKYILDNINTRKVYFEGETTFPATSAEESDNVKLGLA